jgi:hypothetical protein
LPRFEIIPDYGQNLVLAQLGYSRNPNGMGRDSKKKVKIGKIGNTEIVKGVLYSFYSEVTLFFRLSVRVIPARTAKRRDVDPLHT